jgi:hypothetical protein
MSRTGGFDGAAGRIDFKDNVTNATPPTEVTSPSPTDTEPHGDSGGRRREAKVDVLNSLVAAKLHILRTHDDGESGGRRLLSFPPWFPWDLDAASALGLGAVGSGLESRYGRLRPSRVRNPSLSVHVR